MSAWAAARRILCVRLDSLGDVLMCTPALRALRLSGFACAPASGAGSESGTGRSITLLCAPGGAAAAPFIPEIDALIVHEVPWMKGGPGQPRPADLALVETLAAGAFDAAVIFTTYTQSALPAALLCHLAGIPLRLAHCRENPYHLLSDWIPDPEPGRTVRHEVQRQLALVQRVGCTAVDLGLSFVPRAADHAAAEACLSELGIHCGIHHGTERGQRFVLLHPGASAASRRYPPGHWAQAIALLWAQTGLPLVLSGSAADIPLVEAIRARAGVPTLSLAGKLGLGELGAVVQRAAVAVTNNSGPAHIAAAVGTPLVDLYALTNPQHTPWGVRSRVLFHDVPCRFCFKSVCPQGHHDCLAGVAPARVAAAVLDLLDGEAPAAPPVIADAAEQAAADGLSTS
jgi:lipopolysaccharide heptosyltransferase II